MEESPPCDKDNLFADCEEEVDENAADYDRQSQYFSIVLFKGHDINVVHKLLTYLIRKCDGGPSQLGPRKGPVTAFDLKGTWITEPKQGYIIKIVPTDKYTFTARYTNINNDSLFKGQLNLSSQPVSLIVKQYYANGRLYGTYTFTSVSRREISGSLTDYEGGPKPYTWMRKGRQ